jgi:hypothetical protein
MRIARWRIAQFVEIEMGRGAMARLAVLPIGFDHTHIFVLDALGAAWLPSPYPASSYSIADIEAMKVRRAAAAAEAAAKPPTPYRGTTLQFQERD